jgi:Ca2+-binding EF-hand superfamily protein
VGRAGAPLFFRKGLLVTTGCLDRTLIDLFQTKVEVWSAIDLSLTVSKIRGRLDLIKLHTLAATDFGCYTEIPLENMVQYMRLCGVSEFEVSDVEIEYVYRETRTVTAMVLLIRGVVAMSREEFIKKLFHKLDDDDDGLITRDLMIRSFDPQAAPNPKQSRIILDSLISYVGTLPNGEDFVGYSEFAYFWGNISAMFNTDAEFTLLLWKAHSMQSAQRGEASIARDRRSDSIAYGGGGGYMSHASPSQIGGGGNAFARGNSHRSASQAGMHPVYGGGAGMGGASSTLRQHHLSVHNQQPYQHHPSDRSFSRGASGFSRSQSRF